MFNDGMIVLNGFSTGISLQWKGVSQWRRVDNRHATSKPKRGQNEE